MHVYAKALGPLFPVSTLLVYSPRVVFPDGFDLSLCVSLFFPFTAKDVIIYIAKTEKGVGTGVPCPRIRRVAAFLHNQMQPPRPRIRRVVHRSLHPSLFVKQHN